MKTISDFHVHTSFSGDCNVLPETMIQEAISKKIDHLCITDHMDYDYTEDDILFEFDVKEYFKRLSKLKERHQEQIQLYIGIELGLQPYLSPKHHNLVFSYSFDYIIGSIHQVHRIDPYYPSYFKNRSEESAYLEYFECILQNLAAFTNFDVFGHMDYVVRYGPNKNLYYSYQKYREILDEILRILIRKDIGLEVNTGGYKYGLNNPNPSLEVLTRYKEMGGKLITFGSDAHKTEFLAYQFEKTAELLKSCGFSSYYIYKNRIPQEIEL